MNKALPIIFLNIKIHVIPNYYEIFNIVPLGLFDKLLQGIDNIRGNAERPP